MQIKSLGYRTDLIFPRFEGEITDRGNYLVIRTPTNPHFYWGNYLLFDRPPGEGDFKRWRDLFAREIGSPPQVTHQVFGWDTIHGEKGFIEPFLAAGFQAIHTEVLTAQQIHPPARPHPGVTVRPLRTTADWEQAIENQVRCREPEHSEDGHRRFKQRQFACYRRMAEAGLGEWFGAFLGEQLVADLGIYHDGELGRYQNVETHPDYRRQGIAGTLVYQASCYALEQFHLKGLVIVADYEGAPARLYRSLGFEYREQQVGLEWWDN